MRSDGVSDSLVVQGGSNSSGDGGDSVVNGIEFGFV